MNNNDENIEYKQSDSITKKQQFLYNNIIKVNENPELFIEFLNKKKENGSDINNWSYDELIKVVKEFKDNKNSENNDNLYDKLDEDISNDSPKNIIKDSKILSKKINEKNIQKENLKEDNNSNYKIRIINTNNEIKDIKKEKKIDFKENMIKISSPIKTEDFDNNIVINNTNINYQEDIFNINLIDNNLKPNINNDISFKNTENNNDLENINDINISYINNNINNKDLENFYKFLESKDKKGRMINKWKFDDLKTMVTEFKKLNLKKNSIIRMPYIKNNKLCLDNIKILIIKESYKGLILKNLIFEIEILPLNIKINRSEKDIIGLRNDLKVEFPCIHIPPVNCKSYKKEFWQKFFDNIVINKELLKSKNLENFCLNNKYTSKYKNLELKKLNKIIYNNIKKEILENKISFDLENKFFSSNNFQNKFNNLDKNNENITNNILNNLNKIITLNKEEYYNIKHLSMNISDNFNNIATNLDKINVNITNILKNNESVLKNNYNDNIIILNNLKKGLSSWKNEIICKKEYIKEYFISFFHYYRKDFESFQELIIFKDKYLNKLNKKLDELEIKKERLFKNGDYKNWGLKEQLTNISKDVLKNKNLAFKIMLPKETELFEDEKNIFKIINIRWLNEYVLFNNNKINQNLNNFNVFIDKMKEIESKNIFWKGWKKI